MDDPKNKKVIKAGLRPFKKDNTEYSFGALFGYPRPEDLLERYRVGNVLKLHDQDDTDTCSGQTVTAMKQFQEGIPLDPLYAFKNIKEEDGDWQEWGASIKSAAKGGVKGMLPLSEAPYSVRTHNRSVYANPANWAPKYDDIAKHHASQNYFWVEPSGKLDMFDAMRGAMQKFMLGKRALGTGALWRDEWTVAERGIVPTFYVSRNGTPHMFTIIGWEQIDGKPKVVAQLSNGTDIGDNGLFYFDRRTVNAEFHYGTIMFLDMPSNETKESVIEKSQYYRKGIIGRMFFYLGRGFRWWSNEITK